MLLKACPMCNDIWFYVSDHAYGSGYENKGVRVNCRCGLAWYLMNEWQKTRTDAAKKWNEQVLAKEERKAI